MKRLSELLLVSVLFGACLVSGCGGGDGGEEQWTVDDAGTKTAQNNQSEGGGSDSVKGGAGGKGGSMSSSGGSGGGKSTATGGSGGKANGGSGGKRSTSTTGGAGKAAMGGKAGSAAMSGGKAGSGAMSSGSKLSEVEPAACVACEMRASAAPCGMRRQTCLMHDGKATAGPKAGAQKKDLCEDVLACARKTNCAVAPDGSFDIVRCVCGDVSFDDCAAMQMMMPSGACYTEIAAGAETTMLADIGLRQIDPDFGTGAAFQLIQCDKKVCAKSCGICKADDPACVDKAAEGAAMGGAGMGGAMEPTAGMGGAGAGAAGAAGSAGTGH